jgi:hypothetical protein
MRVFFVVVCLFSSIYSFAEEEAAAASSDKRWSVYGTYAYLDTWLPSKLGVTAAYGDDSRIYELAYQKASLSFDFLIDDLGSVSDTRFHLTTRSHTWDTSFNFQYGVYYNSLEITLGDEILGAVGQKFNVVRVDTLGAMWGVGNRWNWDSGLSLGFDWFKIFWPMMVASKDTGFLDETADEGNKDDVEELVDGVSKLPTFTLAHFEIGYRF